MARAAVARARIITTAHSRSRQRVTSSSGRLSTSPWTLCCRRACPSPQCDGPEKCSSDESEQLSLAKHLLASLRATANSDDSRIPKHWWAKWCGRCVGHTRVHGKRQAWEGEAQRRYLAPHDALNFHKQRMSPSGVS